MNPKLPDEMPDAQALSAAFRALDGAEPPAALDAAIVAAARAAVQAQPGADVVALPQRRPRWRAPLALAATVMLAVGIGLQLRHAADETVPAVRPQSTAPVPAAPAAAPAAEPAPRLAVPLQKAAPAESAADAAMAMERQAAPARAEGRRADDAAERTAALERIRTLAVAGELAQARRLAAEFRQRWPTAELPPELRSQLGETGR